MDLATFLLATLVAHLGLAVFVTGHAYLTERDAEKWPYITLAFGLAGLAGYFFYEESRSGRI